MLMTIQKKKNLWRTIHLASAFQTLIQTLIQITWEPFKNARLDWGLRFCISNQLPAKPAGQLFLEGEKVGDFHFVHFTLVCYLNFFFKQKP